MITALRITRSIQFEVKNAPANSVQNRLSPSLLSSNIIIKIHRNTIAPVVLYGSETWSFALREERGLSKILWLKRDGVGRECRRLHKEKLRDLYYSSNKIRIIKSKIIKLRGECSTNGRQEKCIRGSDGEI